MSNLTPKDGGAQIIAGNEKVIRARLADAKFFWAQDLKKPLDELAGGRVFTGKQALELGLVDKIGTLHDALAHVAKEANLHDYDVRVVPAPKNFLELLVEESSGEGDSGPGIALAARLTRRAGHASLVDLAMPYLRNLDPRRVAAVTAALGRLQLLQDEGIVLMMPEIAMPR